MCGVRVLELVHESVMRVILVGSVKELDMKLIFDIYGTAIIFYFIALNGKMTGK
jgi:hypothetical protein